MPFARRSQGTFKPVSLNTIVEAAYGNATLPDYAVTVTIDDAYRSYLTWGHPVFRRHKIPVTVFAVAGFSDGRLWLWPDQIEFAFEHTSRTFFRAEVQPGKIVELDLSTASRSAAASQLNEALKLVPDEARLAFLREPRIVNRGSVSRRIRQQTGRP